MSKNKYLAIVTARSGSKRLPGKNLSNLCGKPLFVWSALAALQCAQVTRTIVSTDSSEYAKVAIEVGADCPWLRDPSLAGDHTSSADVVKDILDRMGEEVNQYRALILLQPTSPLRTSADISEAINLFESRNAAAVVSVSKAECPPEWMGQLPNSLSMDGFTPVEFRCVTGRSRDQWYRLNGAIYIIGIKEFCREHGFIPPRTLGYVMPRERSIDVDTAFDFNLAALLMAQRLKSNE